MEKGEQGDLAIIVLPCQSDLILSRKSNNHLGVEMLLKSQFSTVPLRKAPNPGLL